MYGDAGDINLLEDLPIQKTKMVISTIKKFDENMILLKTLKNLNPKMIVILISIHVEESIRLYEQGADYVIMPHYLGIHHTTLMLEEYGFDMDKFSNVRTSQVNELRNKHKDMMIEALLTGKRER
jgi:Trk K+ transport system NAD-binding subunit